MVRSPEGSCSREHERKHETRVYGDVTMLLSNPVLLDITVCTIHTGKRKILSDCLRAVRKYYDVTMTSSTILFASLSSINPPYYIYVRTCSNIGLQRSPTHSTRHCDQNIEESLDDLDPARFLVRRGSFCYPQTGVRAILRTSLETQYNFQRRKVHIVLC